MAAADRVAYWQRRARDAEREIEFVNREYASCQRWALEAFAEQRRMTDRMCDIIATAVEHGVPVETFHVPRAS